MTSSLATTFLPLASWLPPRASVDAEQVDAVFALIFWICAIFLGIIVAFTARFVLAYRERRFRGPGESPSHNLKLELLWSGIPLFLVLVIYGSAAAAYLQMTEPGASGKAIYVTARRWSWWFDHPEGKGSNELHVVRGERVELVMSAEDVLHSLYVPAFRVKQDVVPGRFTKLAFEATRPGTYPLYCAEYCGRDHSQMLSQVVVHPDRASYEAWIKQSAYEDNMPLAEVGRKVWTVRGCNACHSDDGTAKQGPSFKGMWGRTEMMADGSSVTVDEEYVRESIVDPKARVVAGFQPVMPPTPLEERELRGVIEYLKSLK